MKWLRLILVAVTASAGQMALAHTELSESFPADHAMLESAPEDVRLHFSEPVRLTAVSVQMDGAAKRSLGPLPADALEQFSVTLPALENGHYTVSWRALSEDTHIMTGDLMFAVGATGDHKQPVNHEAETGADHSEQADHALRAEPH
jgi:copper transport protein